MFQSGRCEECRTDGAVIFTCVVCVRGLCCECISCAGLCAHCASRSHNSAGVCFRCGNGHVPLYTCAVCQSETCKNCVHTFYSARPNTVLCKECRTQHFYNTVARCGRCNEMMTDGDMQICCEICAAPLCRDCLAVSFECGVLKCISCCPAPMRTYNDACAQTTLGKKLISMLNFFMQQRKLQTSEREDFLKYRNLRNRELLGEGGQGVVFKCTTLDNEEVVSKEMIFSEEERPIYMAHLLQAQKMQKLSHKHLIKYLDVFGSECPLKISVIMPYYSEGDLSKFILRQTRPLAEQRLCSIILQIATALEYLHSLEPPLAHRDIKPANILLLNGEEQVLLMDLDLCGSCDTLQSASMRVSSIRKRNSPTYEYRAPEMAFSSGSTRSDIFSLGVVSFVLAALPESPLLPNSMGTMAVLNDADWTKESLGKAIRESIYRHSSSYSEEFVGLIVQMVEHRPLLRPTANGIVRKLTSIMEKNLLQIC